MRQYFLVKHDLESFTAMPGFIWRTNLPKEKIPIGFGMVAEGDRWIEFAYIKDEEYRQPCSVITGFRECVKPHWYGQIPVNEGTLDPELWQGRRAHLIKGKRCDGYQPRHPVTVPSIHQMLRKNIQPRVAVARISLGDFRVVREETRRRELDARKIPLLKREPLNEQELLSVVVWGQKELGIEKIIEVQCRFPDLLVCINGQEVYLELEVDSLGFWDHINKRQLRPIRKGKWKGKLAANVRDKDDDRPVAVLCWVDGDKEHTLRKHVPDLRVFELQALLRDGGRITWP